MNAIEIADLLDDTTPWVASKHGWEAAAMLRRQHNELTLMHEVIVKLREALIAHQKAGVGNSTDYATQHAAHMSAHKVLIITEEIAK